MAKTQLLLLKDKGYVGDSSTLASDLAEKRGKEERARSKEGDNEVEVIKAALHV